MTEFNTTSALGMQAISTSNQELLIGQPPATQIQLRKVCMIHLLAAARFASFAGQAAVLQTAAKAFWNAAVELMSTPESRCIPVEGLEELSGLMCAVKCPDTAFQVMSLFVRMCFLLTAGSNYRFSVSPHD